MIERAVKMHVNIYYREIGRGETTEEYFRFRSFKLCLYGYYFGVDIKIGYRVTDIDAFADVHIIICNIVRAGNS